MGKNKEQTRVVVEAGGAVHLLFSVKDTATDGSLHLRFPDLGYRSLNSGERYAVREAHVTVHTSRRHRGNIINATTLTGDGDKLVHRMEICTPSAWLLTPLIGRRQWRLEGPSFTARSKDKLEFLTGYDQTKNSLLFGVWVVAKGLGLPQVQWPFSRHVLTFREFDIAIYYTVIPLPSHPEGDTIIFGTHDVRVNDGPCTVIQANAQTTPGRLLYKNMIWLVNRLADRFWVLFDGMPEVDVGDISEKVRLFGHVAVSDQSERGYRQPAPEGATVVSSPLSFRFRMVAKPGTP